MEAAIENTGREPQNVQVLLRTTERGTEVCLQDGEGVFLTASPETFETETQSRGPGDNEEVEETQRALESLRLELEKVTKERDSLQVQVGELEGQLEQERKRAKELLN